MNIVVLDSGKSIDPVLLSWYSSLTGTKPSSLLMRHLNTVISGLRKSGDINNLDFIQLGGMETSEQTLRPIFTSSSTKLWVVNGSVTVDNYGLTGDGSTGFVDTFWVPSTDGVKYALTDASLGVYVGNNSNTNSYEAGANNGSNDTIIGARSSGVATFGNNVGASAATVATANSMGLFVASRISSTVQNGYKNGNLIVNDTANNSAASKTLRKLYVCAYNSNTVASFFSNKRIQCVFAGNSSVKPSIYNIIQNYMSLRGIAV
jgi:hypothetical protein